MKIIADVLRSKFNNTICHHLALIINNGTKEIGSGIFIDLNGLRFVITAGHVIRDSAPSDLFINLGLSNQEDPLKKLDVWTDDKLDIAFIQLDSFQSDIMRGEKNEPFRINAKQIGFPKELNAIATCGYPKTFWEPNGKYINARSFTIATQGFLPIDSWPPLAKQVFNQDDFLMLSLTDPDGKLNLVDKNGEPASGLNPKGMSGGPLWLFNVEKINEEQPEYALCGVLTGYLEERKDVLVFVKINSIIQSIEKKHNIQLTTMPN